MRAPWLVLLLPAACAAPPPAPPPAAAQPLAPAFDAPQAAEALRGGHNTIHGDAFLFLAQGARQTCAGEVASLIPATNYAEWRMQAIYGDRPALPISDATPHDPTLERYVRAHTLRPNRPLHLPPPRRRRLVRHRAHRRLVTAPPGAPVRRPGTDGAPDQLTPNPATATKLSLNRNETAAKLT